MHVKPVSIKLSILKIFYFIINSVKTVLVTFFIKLIVSEIQNDINIENISNKTYIIIILYFLILLILSIISRVLNNTINLITFEWIQKEKNAFTNLEKKYEQIDNQEYYEKQNRLFNILNKNYINNYVDNVLQIISNVIIIITMMIVLKDYMLIVVAMIIISVLLLIFSALYKYKSDYELEIFDDKISSKTGYLRGTISNFDYGFDIRLLRLQSGLRRKLNEISIVEIDEKRKYYKLFLISDLIFIFAYILFIVLFYAYFTNLLINKKSISISDYSMFISAITTIFLSLNIITKKLFELKYNYKYYCDYKNIINEFNNISSNIDNDIDNIKTIKFNSVNFNYPSSKDLVLENINITFETGKIYLITGENGAGKTTLYNLILKLYDSYNGDILINDENLKQISPKKLISKISILTQDFNFFSFTIRDNLDIQINQEKLKNLLEYFNFDETILSKEYSNRFTKDGLNLSAGELQKLGFIRAVAKNSDVIILDEPFSALDIYTEIKMFNYIKD